GEGAQSLCRACASADFLFAAWFLWMTPLLAALSSLRLVAASNSAALSFSPASSASRKPRTAVRRADFTDWLRRRAFSLVRMRFFCDLMLATRKFLLNVYWVGCARQETRRAATDQVTSGAAESPKRRGLACRNWTVGAACQS